MALSVWSPFLQFLLYMYEHGYSLVSDCVKHSLKTRGGGMKGRDYKQKMRVVGGEKKEVGGKGKKRKVGQAGALVP